MSFTLAQKSLAPLGLALALVSPTLAQDGAVKVTVDKTPVAFSGQQPIAHSGHVLVPLRGVFEKMGAQVAYDSAAKTIKAKNNTSDITLTVGSRQASVDGKAITLDTPTTITNGAVLVPLRFVSENLGAGVQYDGASHTVAVDTSRASAPSTAPMAASTAPASTPMSAAPAGAGMETASTPPAPANTGSTPIPMAAPVATSPAPTQPPGPIAAPQAAAPSAVSPPAATPPVAAPVDTTPTPVSRAPIVVATAPAAPATSGFAQYLPYLIGALVLLGIVAWFLNRRGKTGQVIASNDKTIR